MMSDKYIIYGYQCLLDLERWYIGVCLKRNLTQRHKAHKKCKSGALKFNRYLAKRYGENYSYSQVFKRFILCELVSETPDYARQIETSFIDKYDSINKGFNLRSSEYGGSLTDSHRRKISESIKGNIPTEETRKKISKSLKGRKLSEETCKRMSKTRIGHIHAEETKRKISRANKGRKFSEETCKKMSDAHKGKNKGESHPTITERTLARLKAAKLTIEFDLNE